MPLQTSIGFYCKKLLPDVTETYLYLMKAAGVEIAREVVCQPQEDTPFVEREESDLQLTSDLIQASAMVVT
jgi:hypothetical protein